MIPVLIAAFMCILAIVAWVVIAERLDPPEPGRHQSRKRDPFADPADRDDPYGEQWPPRLPDDGAPDLDALPVGTGQFPALPDDEPADITGVQPAAVRYLGTTSEEYVDELFDKHAEVTP